MLLILFNQHVREQVQICSIISVSIFTFSLDFYDIVGMCGRLEASCSGTLDGIHAFKNMVAQSLFNLE